MENEVILKNAIEDYVQDKSELDKLNLSSDESRSNELKLSLFEKIKNIDTDYWTFHYIKADIHNLKKDYSQALVEIKKVLKSQFTVIFPNLNYRWSDKVGDNLTKNRQQTIKILKENFGTSFPQIAKLIGVSESSIYRNITWLKNNNYIRRIGSAKGGHWEIIDKE